MKNILSKFKKWKAKKAAADLISIIVSVVLISALVLGIMLFISNKVRQTTQDEVNNIMNSITGIAEANRNNTDIIVPGGPGSENGEEVPVGTYTITYNLNGGQQGFNNSIKKLVGPSHDEISSANASGFYEILVSEDVPTIEDLRKGYSISFMIDGDLYEINEKNSTIIYDEYDENALLICDNYYDYVWVTIYSDSDYAGIYFYGDAEYEVYTTSFAYYGNGKPNPSYYDETESIILEEPTKEFYNFVGWTGSNGNTPQKNVSIPCGTTGNLSFTANWELKTGPGLYKTGSNYTLQIKSWDELIEEGTIIITNPSSRASDGTENLIGVTTNFNWETETNNSSRNLAGDLWIDESIQIIRDFGFQSCTELTGVKLPDSVKRLGIYAFSGCSKLTHINKIPDDESGLYQTFANCVSLVEAPEIHNNIMSMEKAFYGCTSLTGEIEINANNLSFYTDCFYGTEKPIKIVGSCSETIKAGLAATANNGNVTY